VAKHLAARNHPTCDCCHDLPHRAVAVAFAMPAGGLVVRVVPGRGARAELGCHETEYFCTGLYITDGVEDRQFIPAMVMGDAPNAESVLPAVVKAEIGTQHISTQSWAASLALLDLSGDCLIRLLRAGPW
jgi:hypothetical protein